MTNKTTGRLALNDLQVLRLVTSEKAKVKEIQEHGSLPKKPRSFRNSDERVYEPS